MQERRRQGSGRPVQEFFHQRRQLGRQEVAAPRWVPGTARVEARAGPLQAQQPAQATPPVSQVTPVSPACQVHPIQVFAATSM